MRARIEPWIAGFLTLLVPGLGHLYAGAPRRAAIVWIATNAAIVGTFLESALLFGGTDVAPMVLLIVLLAIATGDAVRTASHAPRPLVLQLYNRWYVFLALALVILSRLTVGFPISLLVQRESYHVYRIPISSMAPTLLAGDQVWTRRLHGRVNRGDIVVFHALNKIFIKRVVGLAGDTLQMRNDSLFVNGQPIAEPYAMRAGLESPDDAFAHSTWGPVVVRAHSYFMLGDNRGNSLDSREFGDIDADSVTQRPVWIYFSRYPESGDVRWSRIGRGVSR